MPNILKDNVHHYINFPSYQEAVMFADSLPNLASADYLIAALPNSRYCLVVFANDLSNKFTLLNPELMLPPLTNVATLANTAVNSVKKHSEIWAVRVVRQRVPTEYLVIAKDEALARAAYAAIARRFTPEPETPTTVRAISWPEAFRRVANGARMWFDFLGEYQEAHAQAGRADGNAQAPASVATVEQRPGNLGFTACAKEDLPPSLLGEEGLLTERQVREARMGHMEYQNQGLQSKLSDAMVEQQFQREMARQVRDLQSDMEYK